MNIFKKYDTIYRIKCNVDNKTQSLNVTEVFHKIIDIVRLLFTSKLSKKFQICKLKSNC